MDILLIDRDSKMPNLALMQISSYFKEHGNDVGFNIKDPDKVYISCIFKKNADSARGIARFYPDAEIHIGGSGMSYEWLPEPMQKIMPDYTLYDMDYSLGFTTRGCIRNCPFCIVRDKEGEFRRWQHPREFHNPEFKKIMLLDNNLLADREWFFEVTDWILENDLKLAEHGLDIRLLDQEIAERLAELKLFQTLHFAFDGMKDENAVRKGITLLKDAGINLRSQVQFYVLVGYNTTEDEDKYRCRLLKELGTNAFVMPYKKTKWTQRIARWANRKWLYWSIDIDDYRG